MKIPLILAQQNIGVADQPRASGAALALPGQALQQTAQLGNQLQQQLAAINQKKYDQGVKIETATLQSQMEYTSKVTIGALKGTETDPDGFTQAATTAIDDAYKMALAQAKYPESQAYLAQHLQHLKATMGVEVAAHSNQLYKDRNLGLLDVNLSNLRTMASTAADQPAYTPGEEPGVYTAAKGTVDYFNEGTRAIRDATPLLGEKAAADKFLQWRKDFLIDRAETRMRADPLFDLTPYQNVLDPPTYNRLLDKQDTLRREARVEAEHQEKLVQEGVAHENANRVGEIEALLVPTTGSPNPTQAAALLNLYGPTGVNVLKPGDYTRLAGMISNPRDFASDPQTKTDLIANVYRIDPRWSAAQINALHQRGKLNDADTIQALNHLQTTQHSAIERADNKELTALKYKQSEVERIGDRLLNPAAGGMLEKLDQRIQLLNARFHTEMLNASSAFGGKEDPQDVMIRVLPGLVGQMKGDLTDFVKAKQTQLDTFQYKSRAELKAAYDAGKVKKGVFEEQDRVWEQVRVAIEQIQTTNAQMGELFRPRGTTGAR